MSKAVSVKITRSRSDRISKLGQAYTPARAHDLGLTVLEALESRRNKAVVEVLTQNALRELGYE